MTARPSGWLVRLRLCATAVGLLAGSLARAADPPAPLKIAEAGIEPIGFADLDGWSADDHGAAFKAFLKSCRPILKDERTALDPRPMAAALKAVCRRARATGPLPADGARRFFEGNFRPLRIFRLDNPLGMLTGYYEPIVEGSRMPSPAFSVPIYRRPDDLVLLSANNGTTGFPNKAEVGRRVKNGVVVPYFDRGEIEEGALDGRHLEICWIKDPVDAMVVQIEGSARVRLEDGLLLRINYDAHNGLPFTPVGRVLIERNLLAREEMSLDRIRNWMQANPQAAREVRRQNRAFVFFRITGLDNTEDAVGAQGVPLTPGRSIAVDKALHVYGTPFFIAADLPAAGASQSRYRRLLIAQDTGSAIVGPARADLFLGAGEEAGHLAGRIRHPGRFAILVPREIDPASASAHLPLPRPRPLLEAKRGTGKSSTGNTDPGKAATSKPQAGKLNLGPHPTRKPPRRRVS